MAGSSHGQLQLLQNRTHTSRKTGTGLPVLPVLVDEWQDAPGLWDAVRLEVDRHPGPGSFGHRRDDSVVIVPIDRLTA